MISDRSASSDARPPAFLITWASPTSRPRNFAGWSRASMQARTATCRAGGIGSPPRSNPEAYLSFAWTSSSVTVIVRPSSLLALLHRYADQRAVLGPGAVVVLGVLVAEQLGQGEPGVGGPLTDPAVGDDVLVGGDAGSLVQRLQLI